MEYLYLIGLVIVLFFMGVVSPGPNFLVVTQQSLRKGKKAGIVTGLGVAFGDFLYAGAGLFGLATLINNVSWLFGTIKILGGLYLAYLGIKMLLNKEDSKEQILNSDDSINLVQCFRTGLLTDLSNPKTVIFFASIFASVIQPNMPVWVLLSMLLGIVVTSVVWRTGLSYLFSRHFFRKIYLRFRNWIEAVFGVFLILFGIKLASQPILNE